MAILLVNGSPRKGNTWKILEALGTELEQLGHQVESLHLKDQEIKPCIGCYACVTRGEELCPHKDGVNAAWEQVMQADALVFGAPVYALGLPGSMKNFFDRVAWNSHRPRLYQKPAAIIATTAGMGTEQVIGQLRRMDTLGLRFVATKGFMAYPNGEDAPAAADAKTRALADMARKLDREIRRVKPRSPGLLQVIQFYALKLNSTFGKSVYTADHAWYKDKKFSFDMHVNPFKRLLGRLVYRLGTNALGKAVRFPEA